jgi:hypothetical protein
MRPSLVVPCILTALSSACMISPHDEQRVASRDSAVRFRGFDADPNATVIVRAESGAGNWIELGRATSAPTPTRLADGTQMYYWETREAIPRALWRAGSHSGYRARVRPSRVHVTVGPDWVSCYQDHPGIEEFAKNCASPDSPIVNLYTEDYCDVADPDPSLDAAGDLGDPHPAFPGTYFTLDLRDVHPGLTIDQLTFRSGGAVQGTTDGCLPPADVGGGVTRFVCVVPYADNPWLDQCGEPPPIEVTVHGSIDGFCPWTLHTPLDWTYAFRRCP